MPRNTREWIPSLSDKKLTCNKLQVCKVFYKLKKKHLKEVSSYQQNLKGEITFERLIISYLGWKWRFKISFLLVIFNILNKKKFFFLLKNWNRAGQWPTLGSSILIPSDRYEHLLVLLKKIKNYHLMQESGSHLYPIKD